MNRYYVICSCKITKKKYFIFGNPTDPQFDFWGGGGGGGGGVGLLFKIVPCSKSQGM